MKYLARTLGFTAAVILAGTTGAEEPPPLPAVSGAPPQFNEVKDWSQTRLQPDPSLREQIDRTKEFLDEPAARIVATVSRLKTEGILDRRSFAKIRNALHQARGSIARLANGIGVEQQIDGRTARMIAYELGMAADTLAGQVELIETALSAGPNGGDGRRDSQSLAEGQQGQLGQTLRDGSDLLRETARAIVRNLE